MEYEEYEEIVTFLKSSGQAIRGYPEDFSSLPANQRSYKKANFRKKCKPFYLIEERLYKIQPRKTKRVNTETDLVETVAEEKQVEVVREDEVKEVLQIYHGSYHAGRDDMLEKMGLAVWWPAMRTVVDGWISSCTECQQRNRCTWKAPLQPITASRPMERWQMDFTGPYVYDVEVGGEVKPKKKSCLLLVDSFSKMLWSELFSSRKCERVARYVREKIQEEGKPDMMQADNAGEFGGPPLKAVYEEYNVKG